MATSYTSLLGLALPVTGELQGTWGDVVNNYITSYIDASVAGTQTISGSQTAVTLSVTNGTSLTTVGSGATGSAQFQIINCTGNPGGLLTITAPASSRQYIIINATSTNQSVKIVGSGPTTGVTLVAGEKAHVAWNGSDFVKIATQSGNGDFVTVDTTNLEVTNIKAKDGTAALSIADSTGVVSVSANPVLSGGTANGVVYLNGSKVATSGTALVFDGSKLTVSATSGETALLTATGVSNYLSVKGDTGGTTLWAGFGTDTGLTWVGSVSNHSFSFRQNNTEGMRLTSTGLGIGTSSPAHKLDVAATKAVTRTTSTTGTNGAFSIWTNTGGSFYFGLDNSAGTEFSAAYAGAIWHTGAYPLVFATSNTERMRLDSSGNLGLGTATTTNGRLNVQAGTAATGNSAFFSNPDGTYNPYLQIQHSSAGVKLFNGSSFGAASNNLIFGNAGTSETMRIDGSGNLGLSTNGTSFQWINSGNNVAVNGTSGVLSFYTGTSSYVERARITSTGQFQWSPDGTTQAMTLDASGNLLVGDTSVVNSERLLIKGAQNGKAIARFYNTNNTAYSTSDYAGAGTLYVVNSSTTAGTAAGITFFATGSGLGGAASVAALSTNNSGYGTALVFQTRDTSGNDAERARIDSSGNLGLGQAPKAWSAYTAAQVQAAALASTSGNNTVVTSNVYYDGSWKYLSASSDEACYYQLVNGGHSWHVTSTAGTAGNLASLNQAMTLDASGNLVIGNTSASAKLDVSSAGTVGRFVCSGADLTLSLIQSSANPVIIRMLNNSNNWWDTQVNTDNSISWDYKDSEKVRITSGGQFLVGTNSTDTGISVDFQNLSSSSSNVLVRAKNTTLNEDVGFVISGNCSGTQREYTIGLNTIVNSSSLTFSGPTGFQWHIGGSQAMTLDASGRLLIAKTSTSTSEPLQVNGYISSTGLNVLSQEKVNLNNSDNTQSWGLQASGSSGSSYLSFVQNGVAERAQITSGGIFVLGSGEGTATVSGNTFRAPNAAGTNIAGASLTIASGNGTGTGGSGIIAFQTAAAGSSGTTANTMTERARITSGGYFKASNTGTYDGATGTYHEFYQTANGSALVLRATSASQTASVLSVTGDRTTTDNTYNLARFFNGDNTGQLIIRDSGNAINTNGSYGTISDQRLKQDIVDAGSQWADIKAIRFRKYRMKADVAANPDAPALLGVIAQELEQVSPGLVDEHPDMETVEVTDEDGNVTQTQQPTGTTTKTVKSSILLMKAAVALQEAMARIEKLEAEVAALKGV